MEYAVLSLLTDFGLDDGFVAACHGVIASEAPAVRVIDVTHLVPPGDIRRGATVLAQTLPYLPPAVHVAIVDPGVGTSRRPVVVRAGGSLLVGPDNGLLPPVAAALGGVGAVRHITDEALWRHPVSATFHGRDIFCPVGAKLAAGLPVESVGPEVSPDALVRLPEPAARVTERAVEAEIVAIDRFGNLQLGCGAAPGWRLGDPLVVSISGRSEEATYQRTFGAVPAGDLVVFVDSAGLLAIAVNGGRANHRISTAPGAVARIGPPEAGR